MNKLSIVSPRRRSKSIHYDDEYFWTRKMESIYGFSIKHGNEVLYGKIYGMTDSEIFLYAVRNGETTIIKYMIEHGYNIHNNNDEAVRVALENDNHYLIKYMNDRDETIHRPTPRPSE